MARPGAREERRWPETTRTGELGKTLEKKGTCLKEEKPVLYQYITILHPVRYLISSSANRQFLYFFTLRCVE